MRQLVILFLFLIASLLLASCSGAPGLVTEQASMPTQSANPNPSQPQVTGYPEPVQRESEQVEGSYPSSETFLPIAAYPEPAATETTAAYPEPSKDIIPETDDGITASDPQLIDLESGIPTLIEFFEAGCQTCISMVETLRELEREYVGEINFIYLDTADSRNDRLMRKLNFRYSPHYFLLDGDGGVLESWIGQVGKQEFLPAFNAALSPPVED